MDTKTVTPASADPSSSRDDVLSFLDSIDKGAIPGAPGSTSTYESTPGTASTATPESTATGAQNPDDAQSVLDFLDEITQRSPSTPPVKPEPGVITRKPSGLSREGSRISTPTMTSTSRRSGESVRSSTKTPAPGSPAQTAQTLPEVSLPVPSVAVAPPQAEVVAASGGGGGGGGWGWSSVWSQASNVVQQATSVVQQARTVAEEQVKTAAETGIGGLGEGLRKALGENEQAKKWSEGMMEYVSGANLDQLGKGIKSTTMRSLTELINAVAPPIAEHEVIQVSLSHDMVGYDGVETLVYRGLAKIMEQVEGGTLIVNKGDEEKVKTNTSNEDSRNLHYVEGLDDGWKLAEANLDQLIRYSFKPVVPDSPSAKTLTSGTTLTVPITHCPIFLRIQPCLAPIPSYAPSVPSSLTPNADASTPVATNPSTTLALFFLLLLRDPTHGLVHASMSQSMPAAWLDIPFEENEWVEDVMVDVIRSSVEVIGQEYISKRLRGRKEVMERAMDQVREEEEKNAALPVGEGSELAEAAVVG